MVTSTRRLTYEDYANTPDDQRYELIDGELIMAPGANFVHQSGQAKLARWMLPFVDESSLGTVLLTPFDVKLSDNDVVQPDMMFVSEEREHLITRTCLEGAPDLVVEILSPSTSRRDWNEKRELYAKHGVKEYIVMDPSNKIVWRLELKDGSLEIEETYYEGDTITSSVLEGFTVSVNDVF